MREAVGGSLLLNIVIIFASIIILLFVSMLSYSKAYGAKKRIISIIEKNEVYNDSAIEEINQNLKSIGYKTDNSNKCESSRVKNHLNELGLSGAKNLNTNNSYDYCVYEVKEKSIYDNAKYYIVVTFVNFEFPVIGDRIVFPVYGETKILGKSYEYK